MSRTVRGWIARARRVDVGEPGAPDEVPRGAHWEPPRRGHRLGVCLSGGGIRSASFSLGVLQSLKANRLLGKAKYLAAVSGGGYIAAGWAVAHASRDDATAANPKAPWSESSPETRWFRNHSSYLVPSLSQGLTGALRLLAGVVVNVLVVWLLLFVVARPIGWAMHAAQPELGPVTPVAIPTDDTGEMRLARTAHEPMGPVEYMVDGDEVTGTRYEVDLVSPASPDAQRYHYDPHVPKLVQLNEVCFDTPFEPGPHGNCFPVEQQSPVVLGVRADEVTIIDQPRVAVAPCPERRDRVTCDVQEDLEVDQPTVKLTDTDAGGEDVLRSQLAGQLEITSQPHVRSMSGLVDRPPLTFDQWMWDIGLGLLAAGGLVGGAVMLFRYQSGCSRAARWAARALAAAGALVLLTTIVLPWLMVHLPDAVAGLAGAPGTVAESGLVDYLLPAGGFLALAMTALRHYATANKTTTDAAAPSGLASRAWRRLTGAKTALSWYGWSPIKILAGLALVLVPAVMLLSELQYASANGVDGRLMGLAPVRSLLPYSWWLPDWLKWIVALGVMAAFAVLVDAHSWSLYPFYKRQLSSAYLLERDGNGRVRTLDYEKFVTFPSIGRRVTPGDGVWQPSPGGRQDPQPQLVVCCAVNLSKAGVVPPGRRAASFTFSPDHIGGPLVGYLPAGDYWDRLDTPRRRDITVPSAMAISGAAFSPAMGKFNLGPVGSVLAMANLRLGVWLPHPRHVAQKTPASWWGPWRPGFTWFLRELTNRYRFRSRYLYISDGGHWENLGLVELLRRGCTDIVCVNAGGDSQTSFGTISEAIALAREELAVEITLDPSGLRPPIEPEDEGDGSEEEPEDVLVAAATVGPDGGDGAGGGPGATAVAPAGVLTEVVAGVPAQPDPKPPQRTLRRQDAPDRVEPFARNSYAYGTFTYPNGVEGRLWLIEPALTDELPFDVHGFAESEAIFPDDSTADQVFNHRQFEAFRRLGRYQADQLAESVNRALDSPPPAD